MKRFLLFIPLFCLFAVYTPVFAGEVTLSWTPPTQNTDGSPLTDLAGYKIYWGLTEGNYPNVKDISDPTAVTDTVTGLTPGETYVFVATAYNAQNVESEYSNSTTKTVPFPKPNPPTNLNLVAQ